MQLTHNQKQKLYTDGYVKISNAIPRIMVEEAVRAINHSLGEGIDPAEVVTYRCGFSPQRLQQESPDLILLSPGPGRPEDFKLAETIRMALEQGKPIFGVCLGLQGIVEYYGGALEILPKPMHGKASRVRVLGGSIFEGAPRNFEAGRYHSLFAVRDALPEALEVTAESDDGLVMAIEHRELPLAAVQFHPESIMTLNQDVGLRIVSNVVKTLAVKNGTRAA